MDHARGNHGVRLLYGLSGYVPSYLQLKWVILRAVSLIQHIPWIASLRMLIPGVGGKVRRTNKFARELVTERKARGSMTKDLFHHLVSFLPHSIPSYRYTILF